MLGNVNIKSRQAYFHTRFLVVLLPCIIKLYFCNVANALEIELYDKFRCFAAIGILVTGKALRYSYTVQKLLVCGTLALNLSSSSLIVSSYLSWPRRIPSPLSFSVGGGNVHSMFPSFLEYKEDEE